MEIETNKQVGFERAVALGDTKLISEAFSFLAYEDGNNEFYGKSVGGAASCYIARLGCGYDRERLLAELINIPTAFELAREGLWDEFSVAHGILSELFVRSDENQRLDTLEILAIELSEGKSVDAFVEYVRESGLSQSEARVLRKFAR